MEITLDWNDLIHLTMYSCEGKSFTKDGVTVKLEPEIEAASVKNDKTSGEICFRLKLPVP